MNDRREDVRVADMRDANLAGATLRQSNLAGAILCGANLQECDLQGANLRNAQLRDVSLHRANLCGANLGQADLRFAGLEGADFTRVNLNRANLLGARLAGARFDHADLAGAILPDGARYRDEDCLGRFTNSQNPAFAATLEALKALQGDATARNLTNASGERDMSWAQFVERTYGSLANDPIEWQPPATIGNEDERE